MKYEMLGQTGMCVSKTAIGTVPLQRLTFQQAGELIERSLKGGVNFFDTADAYELAEKKLAAGLGAHRSEVFIATKVSGAKNADDVKRTLERSLKDLNSDYIDLIQLHNPGVIPTDPEDEVIRALRDAKRQGTVRHIGATTHHSGRARQIIECGLFETLMYPMTYLSGPQDEALLELARQRGVGVIAMKPFAGGMIRDALLPFLFFRQHPGLIPVYGLGRKSELEILLEMEQQEPQEDAFIRYRLKEGKERYQHLFCRGCDICEKACPLGLRPGYSGRMGDFLYRNPPYKYLTQKWYALMEKVPECTQCGRCAAACPNGCDMREKMKESYAVFMDLWERRDSFPESSDGYR